MNVNGTDQSIVEDYLKHIYETSTQYVKENPVFALLGNTVWKVNRTGAHEIEPKNDTKIDYTFCLDRELLSSYI